MRRRGGGRREKEKGEKSRRNGARIREIEKRRRRRKKRKEEERIVENEEKKGKKKRRMKRKREIRRGRGAKRTGSDELKRGEGSQSALAHYRLLSQGLGTHRAAGQGWRAGRAAWRMGGGESGDEAMEGHNGEQGARGLAGCNTGQGEMVGRPGRRTPRQSCRPAANHNGACLALAARVGEARGLNFGVQPAAECKRWAGGLLWGQLASSTSLQITLFVLKPADSRKWRERHANHGLVTSQQANRGRAVTGRVALMTPVNKDRLTKNPEALETGQRGQSLWKTVNVAGLI